MICDKLPKIIMNIIIVFDAMIHIYMYVNDSFQSLLLFNQMSEVTKVMKYISFIISMMLSFLSSKGLRAVIYIKYIAWSDAKVKSIILFIKTIINVKL